MNETRGQGPRLLATMLLGFALVVASTTVLTWWSPGSVRLRPLVVVVIYAGFHLSLGVGGAAVLVLGYLCDLLSGGFVGLQMSALLAVFLASASLRGRLEMQAWPLQILATALFSLLQQAIIIGGLMLASRPHLAPPRLHWAMAAQAVLSGLTAPFFFALLGFLHRLFVRLWPSRSMGEQP